MDGDFLRTFADLRLFSIGGTPVTVGGLSAAAFVVFLAWGLARAATEILERLRARSRHGGSSIYIVEKLVSYVVIVAGLAVALSTLGLNLTSLAVFAGALGVGVGLGLQGVVKEFVSGLVIIFDRHVNVGDFVELESGVSGIVYEVGPRATRLRTNDNLDIVLPNSFLIEKRVTNWTLRNETRRVRIPFSVAYGVDKEKVREAVIEAARTVPFTEPDTETRRTQVWLTGFGDSSLKFELVVWPTLDAVKRPAAMQAAYAWAIDDALRRACIEIPFPQVDVRLRSLFGREKGEAFEALGLRGAPAEAPPPPDPGTGHNDAAEDLIVSAEAERAEIEALKAGDHEPEPPTSRSGPPTRP